MTMIKVKLEGFEKAIGRFRNDVEKQVKFAAAKALNATAKKVVEAENNEIAKIFDRPIAKTLRAAVVLSYARAPGNLQVVIGLRGMETGQSARESMTQGSKGTIQPNRYLAAHILGGQRANKRFENALIHAKVMPPGMHAVFAKRSNALDPYGNLPGKKIQQILSWFQAYPEGRGFRSNMTAKTKQSLAEGRRKGMKWGFAYFRGGRDTGLPDGIWERHYPNGQAEKSFIRPILIYVSPGQYRQKVRFNFHAVAKLTVDKEWRAQFDQALANAIATAK